MTDNRSVTRFFQTKANHQHYGMPAITSFNSTLESITHVAGMPNTAADFLFRLELTPKEKIELTIRKDIQTLLIQIETQSINVAEEEKHSSSYPTKQSRLTKKR